MNHSKNLLPLYRWAVAIGCFCYVVSPLDAMPEIILGPFGLFDDAGVAIAGFLAARDAIRLARLPRN
jgi:uncharacterized membrane protein YkvA (DUF1232 family)